MEDRVLSDRYRIIKHLARGGMADVFEAEDTLLNRSVAVKVLHANFASDEAFVARFRREAQAAANLSHPNIVAIYDWGKDSGTYFMVMELIRGRTLRQILKTEGALLPRRAAEIAAETAAALSIAHQHGVYHRDVKPGNIMITEDGAVKVTDFGIARALDDSEELTRTGAVIGTATYFSPEQAQGLPADDRSDVYSLGIVLYECLAGKPPFTGESPVAVAYQHVSETAPNIGDVNPEVPPEIAAIAEHAMQKDPASRYQSADSFRDDILRYLSGSEPIAAAAAMAAAATAMIPPPVPSAPLPPGGQPTMAFDEPANERSQTSYWIAVGALIVILLLGLWLLLRLLSGGTPASGTVIVPDFTGVEAQTAFVTLQQELDLKVQAIDETSDEIAAGLVIRTEPPAGSEVESKSFVTVVVSIGPEEFGVPNLIGENVDVARSRIEDQGFAVGTIEYVFTEEIDESIVMAQSPSGGTTAQPDTEVDLVVSRGPSAITVPDVSGKTADTAILELTRAGLESVQTEEAFSPDVLTGFVIETNPAAGQTIPREATVIVIVSMGPEPVDVPDLRGMSRGQAEQTLNNVGLLLTVSSDTVPVPINSGLLGNVAEQDPGAGVTVEVGTEVIVKLGVAQQVAVPDLTNMTVTDAQAAAAAVGLNVDLAGTAVTNDQTLDGLVASQDPGATTLVDEGSFVQVTIYLYQPDVPDFSGMSVVDAQALATGVGLGAIIEDGTIETADPLQVGTIATQDPNQGASVATGTDVKVIVYVLAP
ncbi:MAG: Stk1 family PASTA domain-containing Ser/Thr kinase [Actinomycetia bacterium]|nr:Stk1 family PASTA domain-containing Ser/Thr kinase [Actinomycetes bacterium]